MKQKRRIIGLAIVQAAIVTLSCLATLPAYSGSLQDEQEKSSTKASEKVGKMTVTELEMKKIYEEVKTPYKYGIIIRGEEGKMVDSPNVFRAGGKWYMMYICMNVVGYETHLAASDDLLHWEKRGKILSFRKKGWDAWQADGGVALIDPAWGGGYELEKYNGKYWMSYIGGAKQGYEPDPLAIGMAWTEDPTAVREWTAIPEKPGHASRSTRRAPFREANALQDAHHSRQGRVTGRSLRHVL